MSNHIGNLAVKIESGQILNPNTFPSPNELVCIQVPKVFDQISLRDCVTNDTVLKLGPCVCRPKFSFEKASDFNIIEVKVLSKTNSITKPGYKRLRLSVKFSYNIYYSDGMNCLIQPDEVTFNLTINDIYCPNCNTQIGITRYPKENTCPPNIILDIDGLFIKVEALVEVFNDMISPCTGALILQIGAFFVVKCECYVQLLMPCYGYCPVPSEQKAPAIQNCINFNDLNKTPFPSSFYPKDKPII